jgi:hypothetical protein
MIKNKKRWEDFERELIEKEKVDYRKNFKIVGKLYKFAKKLGRFKASLDGIEIDIKYAKAINGIRKVNNKDL